MEEFLVAIAGPLVNVVIAFGFVLVTSATPDEGSLGTVENAKVPMVDRLASVNLFLAQVGDKAPREGPFSKSGGLAGE